MQIKINYHWDQAELHDVRFGISILPLLQLSCKVVCSSFVALQMSGISGVSVRKCTIADCQPAGIKVWCVSQRPILSRVTNHTTHCDRPAEPNRFTRLSVAVTSGISVEKIHWGFITKCQQPIKATVCQAEPHWWLSYCLSSPVRQECVRITVWLRWIHVSTK